MLRPYYTISNSTKSGTAEIMIFGIIGAGYYGGVAADQFVRDFKYLEKNNTRINIRVNGPGGDVWEGLPIFNVIAESKLDTHTYNDGIAFSMSGVILLAGKTVHVAKGSLAMIHNVSGYAGGNAQDMRETADVLDKHDKVLASLIAGKTGKTEDEVRALWMNYKDNFLTAQEMVDAGLADVLEDYQAKDMPENARNKSLSQIAAFYREQMEEPSQSFLDKVSDKLTNFFNPVNNNNTIDMKWPSFFAFKGVPKPSAEQLKAANAELATESGITGFQVYPEEEITAALKLKDENDRLTNELAAANAGKTTAEASVTSLTAQLATANSTIAANNTKITDLETKVTAFGKKPGAQHQNDANAQDTPPEGAEDTATILNNLAHNRTADQMFG